MKKIYKWVRTNKIVSGIVFAILILITLNLVLMAQFVNILNTFI